MKKNLTTRGGQGLAGYDTILADLSAVIQEARTSAARTINAVMTAAYWLIGRRIVEHEQSGQERAAYGEELLAHLSVDLGQRFGRGFSRRNLQDMRLFYRAYPEEAIRQTLSAKSDQPEKKQTLSARLSFADLGSCFLICLRNGLGG